MVSVLPSIKHQRNLILSRLNQNEIALLRHAMEWVDLPLGEIVHEAQSPISYLYFPQRSMISLVSLMENGATTEIGIIGRRGLVGLPAVLGGNQTCYRAIVQVSGRAIRIPASVFLEAFARSPNLQSIVLRYVQARLTHVAQTAACNRQHNIEQRLARWLLIVQDSIEQETLPLTHEFIANMLGTRRSGVTVAVRSLQKSGVIDHQRGSIRVRDRFALEATACECYSVVRRETERLMDF